jgi:hypothetical protein
LIQAIAPPYDFNIMISTSTGFNIDRFSIDRFSIGLEATAAVGGLSRVIPAGG